MIYVKGTIDSGQKVIIPITENGLFCECPVCGKETSVEYDIFLSILEDGDLEETQVYCEPCSENYRNGKRTLTLIK